jgi:hypothetical protein
MTFPQQGLGNQDVPEKSRRKKAALRRRVGLAGYS